VNTNTGQNAITSLFVAGSGISFSLNGPTNTISSTASGFSGDPKVFATNGSSQITTTNIMTNGPPVNLNPLLNTAQTTNFILNGASYTNWANPTFYLTLTNAITLYLSNWNPGSVFLVDFFQGYTGTTTNTLGYYTNQAAAGGYQGVLPSAKGQFIGVPTNDPQSFLEVQFHVMPTNVPSGGTNNVFIYQQPCVN
jgi:hypothetical protein